MSDIEAPYVRQTLSGAEYVKCITSQESDQLVRATFQNLVLRIAPPGATLFDFGAGPGIDARYFAERGFTVEAYDVDPRMREFFGEHCRELLESGRIVLDCRGYREFVSGGAVGATGPVGATSPARTGGTPGAAGRRADLVISDFAPLNLVDDLGELFAKFRALTTPSGKVLASVLNPYFSDEMRRRWWWWGAPRLWRTGELFMPGPQAPHYRRTPAHFGKLSLPHFRLTRVFPELLSRRNPQSDGIDPNHSGALAWLRSATSRYLFLLFEK